MTRFERACQSEFMMSDIISFCIAAYIEQIGVHEFDEKELKHFINETGESIQKWLMEEEE